MRASPRSLLWIVLGVSTSILALAGLAVGSVSIPLASVFDIVVGTAPGDVPGAWTTIVWELRMPRVLTALVAGAGLAVSGLVLQSFFANPLAGPYVLGISSGAGLGVALTVLLAVGSPLGALLGGVGMLGSFVAAMIGALVVMGTLLFVAPRVSHLTLLILGILFGYASSALVTVLLHFAPDDRLRGFLAWTFGSFADTGWGELGLLSGLVGGGLLGSFLISKSLDVALLGPQEAESLGLRPGRLRVEVILTTSVLAGVVTASCGPIAFLGVVVPHLTRGLFGASFHRVLIPACALVGGSLALAADLIARLPGASTALPLNAVTALLGAPVVLAVVWRRRDLGEI